MKLLLRLLAVCAALSVFFYSAALVYQEFFDGVEPEVLFEVSGVEAVWLLETSTAELDARWPRLQIDAVDFEAPPRRGFFGQLRVAEGEVVADVRVGRKEQRWVLDFEPRAKERALESLPESAWLEWDPVGRVHRMHVAFGGRGDAVYWRPVSPDAEGSAPRAAHDSGTIRAPQQQER